MITKHFVTAGKATFTLAMPASFAEKHNLPAHYTYRVTHKPAGGKWPEAWFVSYLTGSDNESSYSYMGKLLADRGEVALTAKSKVTEDSMVLRLLNRALANLWAETPGAITAAGFDLMHAGTCGRCGRTLTVPESLAEGLGPWCRKMMGLPPLACGEPTGPESDGDETNGKAA